MRGEAQSPGCEACPFAKDGKPVNPVAGEGPDSPLFLIVGEGPGKTERQTDRPFCGESGKMLDRALRSVGADRANVWIGNALLCTPEGATDAKKEQARRCCLPRLEAELLRFPKAPILTLGAVAARPFLVGSIYDYAGTAHTWLGRPAIPTIHPAAILRGGAGDGDEQGTDGLFFNLIYDTSKVHQLASGKIRPFTIDVETGIGDRDQIEKLVLDFCTEARAAKLVGVDLETTSLKTSQAQIRSIGLATVRRGISVWWDDLSIVAQAALHDLLGDEAVAKVFHNRLYDVPILIRYGFPVAGKIHCTLILHANVFFGLPHNLQRVASQIMLIPPWKAEFRVQDRPVIWAKLHNRVASFEKLGVLGILGAVFACAFWVKELLRYNAIDALATVRVLGPLLAMGEKTDTLRCYEADLHDAKVATEIMVEGIPVDVEVNERLGKQFKAEIVRSNDLLQEWATDPAIFAAFKDRLAMELAKAYCRAAVWTKPKKMAPKLKRAADPTDFISRHAVRMVEIPIDLAKAGARYIRARMKGHEDLPRTGLHALGVVGVICAATRRWFRPGSARFHVVAFLKAKKAPLVVETQSGGYSTERKILEGLRWHPNVAALLEFREAQKMLSTFIVKVRENLEADGRVRPAISLPKTSGRWGFYDPMCFDGETEVLTPNGWTRLDALQKDTAVAQFWRETGRVEFAVPTAYIERLHDGEMVRLSGLLVDLFVTPDHRIPLRTRRTAIWRDVDAKDVVPDRIWPINGVMDGGDLSFPIAFLTLLCAVQADGSWDKTSYDFTFVKQRKIARLCQALDVLGVDYSVAQRTTTSRWCDGPYEKTRIRLKRSEITDQVRELLGPNKKFGPWLLRLTLADRLQFLEEIKLWDGSVRGSSYSSSERANADLVQAVAAISGKRGRLRAYTGSPAQTKINWQVDLRDRNFAYTSSVEVVKVPWKGTVYCLSVPSTYLLVRRGQNVVVAGNCQNWPEANERKKRPNLRQQVVAPEGFEIVGFDFDKQEARGVAFLSGDQLLCEYLQPGRDLWTEMSRLVWPDFDTLAKEQRKVLRNFIKRPGYGSLYKGSVDTLWQNLLKDDPAVKREDVARVVTILQTRLVGVNAWHEELFRQVAKPPHQLREHLLGRLWTWPLGRYSPNDITNYPVQALGASLMKLGLRRIYEGGLPAGTQGMLHVHDAFYWLVPKSSVAEMKEKINSSFTQTHTNPAKGITMIFPVEAKSGRTLAEL